MMIHTATQRIALGFGVLRHVESHLTVLIGVLVHDTCRAHLTRLFGVWIHVSIPFRVQMHAVSHLTSPFGASPPRTPRVILCLRRRVKTTKTLYT